jgi:hypothetical protein
MTFKQTVYQEFLKSLNEKIDSFQNTIDELSISVMNETKSTAGDKHETALSMLQADQSRMAEHLYEAVDNKTIFSQINIDEQQDTIRSGSLVKTTHGYFFISIALPKIKVDNIQIIAISPQSPLGEKLIGLKKGDCIEMNSIVHCIEEIQ